MLEGFGSDDPAWHYDAVDVMDGLMRQNAA